LIERRRHFINVFSFKPLFDPRRINVNTKKTGTSNHSGKRLRPTHSTKASRKDPLTSKVARKMLPPTSSKCFVSPLQNSLSTNINPRARCHLPIHHQALFLELIKNLPSSPLGNQIRISNQNPRSIQMRFKNPNR